MAIRVACYGGVRETVGGSETSITVAGQPTVTEVLAVLVSGTSLEPEDLIVTRDGRHLDPDHRLTDGARIAVTDRPMPE